MAYQRVVEKPDAKFRSSLFTLMMQHLTKGGETSARRLRMGEVASYPMQKQL